MRAVPILRRLALAALLLLSPSLAGAGAPAAVCGLPPGAEGPQDDSLRHFAHDLGLKRIEAFVSVANTLHDTGRLPGCYLTRKAARAKGWRPGGDLWRVAPGSALGGDVFANRQHRLPAKYNGRYREADLDYAGGRRGAHRLIYVADGQGTWWQWVTVDHYRHFFKLPEAQ